MRRREEKRSRATRWPWTSSCDRDLGVFLVVAEWEADFLDAAPACRLARIQSQKDLFVWGQNFLVMERHQRLFKNVSFCFRKQNFNDGASLLLDRSKVTEPATENEDPGVLFSFQQECDDSIRDIFPQAAFGESTEVVRYLSWTNPSPRRRAAGAARCPGRPRTFGALRFPARRCAWIVMVTTVRVVRGI